MLVVLSNNAYFSVEQPSQTLMYDFFRWDWLQNHVTYASRSIYNTHACTHACMHAGMPSCIYACMDRVSFVCAGSHLVCKTVRSGL